MTPERCAQIHAACFTMPRPWSATEFAALFASKGVFLCSVKQGFALGRIAGPEAELLTLAVHPDIQRQGFARHLMMDFEETARISSVTDLFLEVAANNSAAIALYASVGFNRAGQRKDYYHSPHGPRVSALVFRKLTGDCVKNAD